MQTKRERSPFHLFIWEQLPGITLLRKTVYNSRMEPTLDEALLTAYLDGELTPLDRQRLERRLANEPELRQRLTLLEETWHYLDLLEQESADAEKIETTMNLLAVAMSAAPFPALRVNRWGRWSIAALAGLTVFAGTFYFGTTWNVQDNASESSSMADMEKGKRLAETLVNFSFEQRERILNDEPAHIISELEYLSTP